MGSEPHGEPLSKCILSLLKHPEAPAQNSIRTHVFGTAGTGGMRPSDSLAFTVVPSAILGVDGEGLIQELAADVSA